MKLPNSKQPLFFAALILLFSALGLSLPPQQVQDSNEAQTRLRNFTKHQQMRAATPFTMKWTGIGPMSPSGRMVDVEVHPAEPTTVYAGVAQGGVWKSTDDGTNWFSIFDDYPAGSIGDIAIAPSNPKIVWVGTGEANIFRSSQTGIGIYKSVDAGQHFTYMGLADTQHIARVIVHPKNPEIVYVAAPGHEYTYNKERGIFRTTNGGKSWQNIFYRDEKTGVIDLAMDPSNPDIMYASTGERLRYRWNDPKPTPQTGIYKTVDGGKTWKPLSNGLPDFSKGECERIGIDICRARPNVVYALIDQILKDPGGKEVDGAYLFRSDDGGDSWRMVEGNDRIKSMYPGYGWVFGQVRVDPVNPDLVYIMGLNYLRSKDGGKTWESPPARGHSDWHGMWINPNDTNHIVVVNDGGFMISRDGLATAKHPVNLPIGHLFSIAVGQTKGKFWAYSNVQDSGGWRGEIDVTAGKDKITWKEWVGGPGDEAGRHAVSPENANIVFGVTRYGGGPYRADFGTVPPPPDPAAQGARGGRGQRQWTQTQIAPSFGTEQKRAQWVAPIVLSPHSAKRVFFGAQFLFVSDDEGKAWRKISSDLTNYDKQKQGNINYSTIWAIAESPLKKGLIYAGTDDGNLAVTRDEGETWEKINTGLPADLFMASIEASRFVEGTVYVVVNGKRHNDFNTYLFKSTNYGKSWNNIATAVPGGIANVVKEDPTNQNILYLGTDLSTYVTIDGGNKWQVLGSNLPTAHVFDLAIQTAENLVVIGTHGRSAWAIDIDPVRAAAKK